MICHDDRMKRRERPPLQAMVLHLFVQYCIPYGHQLQGGAVPCVTSSMMLHGHGDNTTATTSVPSAAQQPQSVVPLVTVLSHLRVQTVAHRKICMLMQDMHDEQLLEWYTKWPIRSPPQATLPAGVHRVWLNLPQPLAASRMSKSCFNALKLSIWDSILHLPCRWICAGAEEPQAVTVPSTCLTTVADLQLPAVKTCTS